MQSPDGVLIKGNSGVSHFTPVTGSSSKLESVVNSVEQAGQGVMSVPESFKFLNQQSLPSPGLSASSERFTERRAGSPERFLCLNPEQNWYTSDLKQQYDFQNNRWVPTPQFEATRPNWEPSDKKRPDDNEQRSALGPNDVHYPILRLESKEDEELLDTKEQSWDAWDEKRHFSPSLSPSHSGTFQWDVDLPLENPNSASVVAKSSMPAPTPVPNTPVHVSNWQVLKAVGLSTLISSLVIDQLRNTLAIKLSPLLFAVSVAGPALVQTTMAEGNWRERLVTGLNRASGAALAIQTGMLFSSRGTTSLKAVGEIAVGLLCVAQTGLNPIYSLLGRCFNKMRSGRSD